MFCGVFTQGFPQNGFFIYPVFMLFPSVFIWEEEVFKQGKNAMPNPRPRATEFGSKKVLNDAILGKSSFCDKPFSLKT